MKKLTLSFAGAFCLFAFAAFAADSGRMVVTPSATTGNGAPSGPHYNLNIIGVDNPKTDPMTGGDGHTIFVALGSKKTSTSVESNIWLTQGPFQVCDGNGFDAAYNCAGAQVGRGMTGAVFQLPCNTLVPTDFGCVNGTEQQSYTVWARALGGPAPGRPRSRRSRRRGAVPRRCPATARRPARHRHRRTVGRAQHVAA